MVIETLARKLLDLAVRRSPAADRDENRREWDAELAVLLASRHHARGLRYAASLAAARQEGGPELTWGAVRRVGRLVVAAPILAVVLLFLGLIVTSIASAALPQAVGSSIQSALLAVYAVVAAVGLGLLGRRWTVRTGRAGRIVAAVVPGFAVTVLFNGAAASPLDAFRIHAPAAAVFFAGLAAALAFRRFSWGVGGAFVAADLATVVSVMRSGEVVDHSYAPAWLWTSLSGYRFPGMSTDDALLIWDVTGLDPYLYVSLAGLAFGAVLAGKRPQPISR